MNDCNNGASFAGLNAYIATNEVHSRRLVTEHRLRAESLFCSNIRGKKVAEHESRASGFAARDSCSASFSPRIFEQKRGCSLSAPSTSSRSVQWVTSHPISYQGRLETSLFSENLGKLLKSDYRLFLLGEMKSYFPTDALI